MLNDNLFELINENLEELLVINKFDLELLKEDIKTISINYTIDYLNNKATLDELVENILFENPLLNVKDWIKGTLDTVIPDSSNINDIIHKSSPSEIINYFADSKISSMILQGMDFLHIPNSFTDVNKIKQVELDEESKMKILNMIDSLKDQNVNYAFRKLYSNIFNSMDINTLNKDLLFKIVDKHKDYGITIKPTVFADIASKYNINTETVEQLNSNIKEIATKFGDEFGITKGWGLISSISYGVIILAICYIVFNRSRNSITFIYYKICLNNLIKFFKSSDYFSSKAISKLSKYEFDFEKCSNYRRIMTPIRITFSDEEAFKLRNCFIKYIGSTFLFLMRQYKDYLKYLGIQVPNNIQNPIDILTIRNERINVNIKNNLFEMNKIINIFLDDVHKQKLNILFKLTISDNFDISRFEFDDFK